MYLSKEYQHQLLAATPCKYEYTQFADLWLPWIIGQVDAGLLTFTKQHQSEEEEKHNYMRKVASAVKLVKLNINVATISPDPL